MADIFNEQAFEADVKALIAGSPFGDLLSKGLKLSLKDFSGDLKEIKKLCVAIVASVEVVKTNLKAQHPNEDWNHIAIETAAKILKDSITLPGIWGKIGGFLVGPVVRAFLEGTLGTFKALAQNKEWLALAKSVLALV
jgi:hypothetical protein